MILTLLLMEILNYFYNNNNNNRLINCNSNKIKESRLQENQRMRVVNQLRKKREEVASPVKMWLLMKVRFQPARVGWKA